MSSFRTLRSSNSSARRSRAWRSRESSPSLRAERRERGTRTPPPSPGPCPSRPRRAGLRFDAPLPSSRRAPLHARRILSAVFEAPTRAARKPPAALRGAAAPTPPAATPAPGTCTRCVRAPPPRACGARQPRAPLHRCSSARRACRTRGGPPVLAHLQAPRSARCSLQTPPELLTICRSAPAMTTVPPEESKGDPGLTRPRVASQPRGRSRARRQSVGVGEYARPHGRCVGRSCVDDLETVIEPPARGGGDRPGIAELGKWAEGRLGSLTQRTSQARFWRRDKRAMPRRGKKRERCGGKCAVKILSNMESPEFWCECEPQHIDSAPEQVRSNL